MLDKTHRLCALVVALFSASVCAAPGWQNDGKGINPLSHSVNPAQLAYELQHSPPAWRVHLQPQISAGLEYGEIDALVELINDTSRKIAPSEPDGGGDKGVGIGDIIIDDPDFQKIIAEIRREARVLGTVLGIIAVEGYGKAFAKIDLPVLIHNETGAGRWGVTVSTNAMSKALGIAEALEFDGDQALAELLNAWNLTPDDPLTTFDLSGGLSLIVDPASGAAKIRFTNDSAMVVRSAQITELAVTYSRSLWQGREHQLFVGFKPKLYQVGLSKVAIRMGDLTDSRSLFRDIDTAELRYDEALSWDLGILWSHRQFYGGLNIVDINQPNFRFPELNTARFSDPAIIERIKPVESYEFDTQFRVNGGIRFPASHWTVDLSVDANGIRDPLGDEYQWLSLNSRYQSDSWGLSGLRLGLQHNLAAQHLTYVHGGVTVLKYLNIDMAGTWEFVEIQGNELPRGLILSIGFNIPF